MASRSKESNSHQPNILTPDVLKLAHKEAEAFSPLGDEKEVGAPLPSFYTPPHSAPMEEVDEETFQICADQGLIGVDRHIMHVILPAVRECANAPYSVLITGETGTGKEVVARCIHSLSRRAEENFVPINTGGLPTELVESELFGHEQGAFSGATRKKKGQVEVADGGTLFLDEIGDMPMSTQAKLLRFLNDGKFFRVGGTKEMSADVRIIAATNKDPKALVGLGQFRSDLYFRLNTIEIGLWPLYLRPADLPLLIYYFILENNQTPAAPIRAVHQRLLKEALFYRWPGNIRELKNRIVRACHAAQWQLTNKDCLSGLDLPISASGDEEWHLLYREVELSELPGFATRTFLEKLDKFLAPEESGQWTLSQRACRLWSENEGIDEVPQDPIEALLDTPFPDVKKQYLTQQLDRCGGNVMRAAKKAGVSRSMVSGVVDVLKKDI